MLSPSLGLTVLRIGKTPNINGLVHVCGKNIFYPKINPSPVPLFFLQPSRAFAARKGTRARKEKKKVKKEDVKTAFVFKHLKKAMEQAYVKQRPFDDSHYNLPVDDVFIMYKFRRIEWPFADAVQNFKDLYHPTVCNLPDAPLSLKINLDLTYPNRATKCQDGWRSVIEMPHPFLIPGMVRPSVLAFCPEDVDYIAGVLAAGADVAGGKEIIKAIQEGEISAKDFEYIVAHPTIVPDLTAIRGLIKKAFPTMKNKTVSTDLGQEVRRLKSGLKIRVVTNDREPDFGCFELPIGTLNMPTTELESNFLSVLRDTVSKRVSGKDPEKFLISCVLRVLHNQGREREHFKVKLSPYLDEFKKSKTTSAPASSETEVEVEEGQEEAPEQKSQVAA